MEPQIFGEKTMYLNIHRPAAGLWMIEGKRPKRNILFEPDIANAGVYRSDENLYIFDTGATHAFAKSMKNAIDEALAPGPVQVVYLLNSHSHIDHVGNNDILNYPPAKERFHYLDYAGILDLHNQKDYFRRQFKTISEYFDFADGPKLPWGIMMRLLKLTRIFGSDLQFKIVLDSTLRNFGPLHPSTETVASFPEDCKRAFNYGKTTWLGWNLNDEVHALNAAGHSPDEVIFYLPRIKALIAGDETLEQFVCWPESRRARSIEVNKKCRQMVADGFVEIFFDSHHHEVLAEPEKTIRLLDHLLEGDSVFADIVFTIVENKPGLTVHRIWKRVYKYRNNPFVKERCDLEFPAMPGFLKTVITCLLLESKAIVKGKVGKKRFYPPADAGFSRTAL
jgi:glyoxylase-like metal-dependent hydrolase (beta-lactamase superfamily II)